MVSFHGLVTLGLLSVARACGPATRDDSFIVGPDSPSDPETLGYFINHFSLNVNNLTRSIEFYTEVFGMRHMFTSKITPNIYFAYLGHSSGGKNGTAYQTTQELIRYKNNQQGMIELVYLNVTGRDIPGPDTSPSTLNHIGIIVPDTSATQKRLEKYGVTVYKGVGAPMPDGGPLFDPKNLGGENLSAEEYAQFKLAMNELNKMNIFAADPDGNLLEILPLDERGLFG